MDKNMEMGFRCFSIYYNMCKPVCHQFNLPQTAFDILMFLGNNPKYKTAGDIVRIRRIKANLVSINVDKLVHEGYLLREAVEGDRRKTGLLLTDKAQSLIQKGNEIQTLFIKNLFDGIQPDEKEIFFKTIHKLEENLEHMKGC